jgi:hypothetical protein
MTALAQNSLDNNYVPSGRYRKYPVAATTVIYRGAGVMLNAAGYLIPASDTSGGISRGVSRDEVDNNPGSAGDLECEVDIGGCEVVVNFGTQSALTQANVGDKVFWKDDQTVELAGTSANDIFAGTIERIGDAYGANLTSKCLIRCATPGEVAAN